MMTQTWVPSVREGTLRSAPCCMGVPPLGGQALCSDPITQVYNMGVDPRSVPQSCMLRFMSCLGVDPRSVPQVLMKLDLGVDPRSVPLDPSACLGVDPRSVPPRLFILYLMKLNLEMDPRSVLQDSSG